MEKLRAFIAVQLGEAAQREACRFIDELRAASEQGAVRWVRPEGVHMTLRFLGDVLTQQIPMLTASVSRGLAAVSPFELQLAEAFAMPSRRPRVLALDVEPHAPVQELAERVEAAAVEVGFEPETRRFKPHVTLGRVRSKGAPPLAQWAPPEPSPFLVREVVLFRSELGAGGSRYTPLEHWSLGGTAP